MEKVTPGRFVWTIPGSTPVRGPGSIPDLLSTCQSCGAVIDNRYLKEHDEWHTLQDNMVDAVEWLG